MYETKQYFLFSYYGSGINFTVIALLKWDDVNNGRIFYKRSKTNKAMNFKILEPIKVILDYWKPFTGMCKANYIFPILNRNRHKELKEIGKLAKIEIPLTTYVARTCS